MKIENGKLVEVQENETKEAKQLGFTDDQIFAALLDTQMKQDKLELGNVTVVVKDKEDNKNMGEVEVKNIYELRTEKEINEVLKLVKDMNSSFKSVCSATKKDKLEMLLSLKVREVGLGFTSKILGGEYENEDKIEQEIKTLLPQLEKTSTNILNKLKNLKLKAGKSQDKAYLASMKKEIFETLSDCEDIDELKLTIRGLYLEHHQDLGLPEVEVSVLKDLINTLIELLHEDVKVKSPSAKEEVKTTKIAQRLSKVVRFYDNKAYELEDMINILFKSDVDENTVKVKDLLFKLTGEAKYIK